MPSLALPWIQFKGLIGSLSQVSGRLLPMSHAVRQLDSEPQEKHDREGKGGAQAVASSIRESQSFQACWCGSATERVSKR